MKYRIKTCIVTVLVYFHSLNVKAAGKCTDAVAKVFLLCADSKWEDGNDKRTHRHEMLITITQSYFLNVKHGYLY